jgi:hypothetical protein
VTTDTTLSNGKQYAFIPGGPFTFQRQDGARVYRYNGNSDELLFDFSKSVGDTVVSVARSSDTTDIILVARDTVTLFGRRLRHWSYFINWSRRAIDDEQGYDIVDSIGITEIALANATAVLHMAMIDGQSFETTSADPIVALNNEELWLGQNYPNPFNPETRIVFTIPCSGIPFLRVFNRLGQEVYSRSLGFHQAGAHEIDFDGRKLSSGVYFYRMEFGLGARTRTFILLK